MRRFYMKENIISRGQKLMIMNEDEKCLCHVKSTCFALGDKFTVLGGDDNELFKIRKQWKHLRLEFDIYNAAENYENDDHPFATSRAVGNRLQHELEIHSVYGDYLIEQDDDIERSAFTLSKDGKMIAQVRWPTTFDKRYFIEINEDIPFVLGCAENGRD
ncbi:unnamed protein product [Rotaria magnacalcarata]|uniref:Uncharacterized protein n=2 Tax=Rotaria magnacalcarata TaxID=392030 RepID=A0A8S3GUA4_9BILA|nr:unnamed protein product [Rotaria magnacalcarata]